MTPTLRNDPGGAECAEAADWSAASLSCLFSSATDMWIFPRFQDTFEPAILER